MSDCLNCGDSKGWIQLYNIKTHNTFVIECGCRKQRKGEQTVDAMRIPERYTHCALDNYIPQNDSQVDALTTAAHFAAAWPAETNGNGLLLTGWLGVGKTHLASSILRDIVLNRKVKGVFYEYRELLKAIQNSYNKDVEETEASILRPVFEADVLVIDELGSSRRTDWVWEMVEHILNTRYNDHRTTIITTNYVNKPAGAPVVTEASTDAERARAAMYKETLGDRIGDRMRSRLQEMCVCVEMAGKDFREDVKRARFGFTPL